MKRFTFVAMVGIVVLALVAWLAPRAIADDETDDTKIKIQAPLEAVDCSASPPTITVLGLTIDISTAAIGPQNDGSNSGTCADLVVGQAVEVQLASDATPLAATTVDQGGGDNGATVQGPLQAIDSTAQTVTVLGLTIDVSQAHLGGADDNAQDGNNVGIDLSMLMVGQFAELQLASSQPPLTATQLQVKNFANEVDVQEVDGANNQVDDGAANDIQVDVEETVMVQAAAASGGAARRVKRIVHVHALTNGGILALHGLPTGRAKIVATRVHNGVTSVGRRIVWVRPNTTRLVRLRLRGQR